MFKKLIAIACTVFLMVPAFAASEERILQESTKDGNWQQFLSNLATVEVGGVKGYNPETNTVLAAGVLVWVCQNQAPVWKASCTKLPERYEALKARNGWGDNIPAADLKVQGQSKGGVYFPFAEAPVAATTAPAAVVAKVMAPATVPTTPGVTAEQVAVVAKAAAEKQVQGFDKALQTFNGQLAAKDAAIADMRKQSAAEVAALKQKLQVISSAREGEALSLQEAHKKAEGAFQAAVMAAGDALDATSGAKAAKEEATQAGLKAARAIGATNRNTDNIQTTWYVGAAAVLLLMSFGAISWRRVSKVKVAAVQAAEAKVEEALEPIKGDIEELQALVGKREVVFPDEFAVMVDHLGRSDKEPAYVAKLQISGVAQPAMITVTHAEAGYVYVGGVPGHDQKALVRVHKPKASKKYNGVELLVFAVANRGGFDYLNQQKAA